MKTLLKSRKSFNYIGVKNFWRMFTENLCQIPPPTQCYLPAPAVSVVIPMYNTEKYISECLESVLNQTFQSFEVIVVDDCSTDLSREVVESYIPIFDGRLRLFCAEKNSGHPGTARNKGTSLSCGEYIFYLDSDDKITETALEELYTLAKDYDADVVYCEKYYSSNEDGKNIQVKLAQKGSLVDKPTLETENLKERVQKIISSNYWSVPWLKMVRRKFVISNKIFFPPLSVSEDNIWTQGLLFYAKNFLRVPNTVYIYRYSQNSMQRKERTPQQKINFWLRPILLGLKSLDELMNRHKFFQENPSYRYEILERFINVRFKWIQNSTKELSKDITYETIKNEFGKYFDEYDVTISALCTYLCEQIKFSRTIQKKLDLAGDDAKKDKQRIAELESALEKAVNRLKRYNNLPAVSVVIPLYNMEKYVSECLDSLFIQTFQDFEIIVVDDCSTDSSPAIVKNYILKFGERLTLTRTEKNSGGGGHIPRNLGLKLARGEYIIFIDSDDALVSSALETLYNAAKEYDTDVVYYSAYYEVRSVDKVLLHRDGLGRKLFRDGIEDKTLFTADNSHEIFQNLVVMGESEGNFHQPWSKFVRRDFLLKNEIFFPNDIMVGGDCLWCVNVFAYAKRFLRLPVPLYFYRCYNDNSITRTVRTPAEQTNYWISAAVNFLKGLNELQNKVEFLREHPVYCLKIAEKHFDWYIYRVSKALSKFGNRDIYKILSYQFFHINRR